MADRLGRQEFPFLIEFSHFSLQESAEEHVPEPYPDGRDPAGGSFLTTRVGRIDVESAGHTHTTTLVYEVWDSQPPAEESSDWDERQEARIVSQSGELTVWTVGGAGPDCILLGRRDTAWRVRVSSAGRDEAKWQAQQGVPTDVERYLMQFWPVEG
ncbi:hypothetical protein [Streptomyces celluloflavus]|uniref:hypothetical protein n=1 Tax=Streptomyces celluloflavus TaxID=58344 RepID=UPI00345F98DD|nr:hypothetical protein OG717_29975 [Streptomyces celluloflavus]